MPESKPIATSAVASTTTALGVYGSNTKRNSERTKLTSCIALNACVISTAKVTRITIIAATASITITFTGAFRN